MQSLPKVLVFSNNCFSKTDSNGRTLGVLFDKYPREKLAQFYIQGAQPDFVYCDNYFRVTDMQAFKSLLLRKPHNCVVKKEDLNTTQITSNSTNIKKIKRTPITMLIRNIVWDLGFWKTKEYKQWLCDFDPDIILLQVGDSVFMIKLALREAKKRKKPLVVFNTEGYYFKDFDYFRSTGIAHKFYNLFIHLFRKQMNKLLKNAAHLIYPTDELKSCYDEICSKPTTVIYTSTDITPDNRERKERDHTKNGIFRVSYLGNLGVGRHIGLINIANVLNEINPQVFLDVYGKIPNETVKKDFENCHAIKYNGMVSYEEVKNILNNSDLIVHTESFEDFYCEDLKFAFSTKIADALACGTSFFVFAPPSISCIKYLKQYGAAHIACDKTEMHEILRDIMSNSQERHKYIFAAQKLAREKHNSQKNQEIFYNILMNIHNITKKSN